MLYNGWQSIIIVYLMGFSIRLFSLALLQLVVFGYDFYLVRHGARAPLGAHLPLVFGVAKEQLTAAGRSQAYYLGQELNMRHYHIGDDEMLVHSLHRRR